MGLQCAGLQGTLTLHPVPVNCIAAAGTLWDASNGCKGRVHSSATIYYTSQLLGLKMLNAKVVPAIMTFYYY